MAHPVIVIKNPVVEYQAAGTSTWVDISKWFFEFSIMLKKAKVDTKSFESQGGSSEKGEAEHQVKFGAFHSRDNSTFSALMEAEFNQDDDTLFRVKYLPTSITAANPRYQVGVKMLDLGTYGGKKNDTAKMEISLDVEGLVSKTIDGTTFTSL